MFPDLNQTFFEKAKPINRSNHEKNKKDYLRIRAKDGNQDIKPVQCTFKKLHVVTTNINIP